MIFIKLVAITLILSFAWKISISSGMLLEKIGFWLESKNNKFWDWFLCPFCMVSLISIVAHLFAFGLNIAQPFLSIHFFLRWILVICASSFISGNAWNLYETINVIKEKNQEQKNVLEKENILLENRIEEYTDDEIEYEDRVFNNQHN